MREPVPQSVDNIGSAEDDEPAEGGANGKSDNNCNNNINSVPAHHCSKSNNNDLLHYAAHHGGSSQSHAAAAAKMLLDAEMSGSDARSDEIAASRGKMFINVGGTRFKVKVSNFARMAPKSRLFRLVRADSEEEILRLCDGFTPGETPEYFFNRSWATFNSILDFYRKGTLHMTTETCALVFKAELSFWGIDELFMDPCCALKYYPEIEACQKEVKSDIDAKKREEDRKKYENFGPSLVGRVRSKLWNITEYPETSFAAQV